jgi:type I restriction enzyme S subunit
MNKLSVSDLLLSQRAGYWGGPPGEGEKDVLVIRNGDVKPKLGILWDRLPSRSMTQKQATQSRVAANDLLITTSGECGVTAFVGREPSAETCATNFVRVLRPNPSLVNPRYLFHFTCSSQFRTALRPYIRGTTMQNLATGDALSSVHVPVPSLDEQGRVAATLDRAGALVANRQRAISRTRELVGAVFADMFGDPVANERGWETAPLGEVCARVTDGEHKTPPRTDAGIPLLSARSIQAGWIDFTATDFIEKKQYDLLRKRIQPQRGDVLISCSGTIGRVARVRDEPDFAMVRSVAIVRPGPALSPAFLEQLLSSPSMNTLMNLRANSSAQANLFQNQIKALPLILPPAEVQREFERRLEFADGLQASAVSGFALVDELATTLRACAFDGGTLGNALI